MNYTQISECFAKLELGSNLISSFLILILTLLFLQQVSYNAHMLWFITARTLLSHSHIMDFSRLMLKAIMKNQRCLGSAEVSGCECGHLFTELYII